MQNDKMKVIIFRHDGGMDDKPRRETYEVPYEKGMKVLDALIYIYENLDHSLAFRYSCKIGRCFQCGMTANGKRVYACLKICEDNMIIKPSRGSLIVRDLVVKSEKDRPKEI